MKPRQESGVLHLHRLDLSAQILIILCLVHQSIGHAVDQTDEVRIFSEQQLVRLFESVQLLLLFESADSGGVAILQATFPVLKL